MTDPHLLSTGAQDQSPPQKAKPSAEDLQSSKYQEAHLLRPSAKYNPEDESVNRLVEAGPLKEVHVNDPQVWRRPQVLSPTAVHGKRYEMTPVRSPENAEYRHSASFGISPQSPGTGVVPYQPPLLNADPRPLPVHANRLPVFPGSVDHNGQTPLPHWSSQGLRTLPHYSNMQNVSSAPAFAYYVPYPMVPQMPGSYPVYGQPQYHATFVQTPVLQQQYAAPQAYSRVDALDRSAGNRSVFVREPSQQVSTSQQQHQEAQRPSASYRNGSNSRNTEWSNRFGRPGSVQPSLPTLPYRPGSDDMFPQTAVEGASVRLQELTRNGQPSLAMALSREIAPFAETARNTKPAGWGVVKIGNVSKGSRRRVEFVLSCQFT